MSYADYRIWVSLIKLNGKCDLKFKSRKLWPFKLLMKRQVDKVANQNTTENMPFIQGNCGGRARGGLCVCVLLQFLKTPL